MEIRGSRYLRHVPLRSEEKYMCAQENTRKSDRDNKIFI